MNGSAQNAEMILLTCDGQGKDAKRNALNGLLVRIAELEQAIKESHPKTVEDYRRKGGYTGIIANPQHSWEIRALYAEDYLLRERMAADVVGKRLDDEIAALETELKTSRQFWESSLRCAIRDKDQQIESLKTALSTRQ